MHKVTYTYTYAAVYSHTRLWLWHTTGGYSLLVRFQLRCRRRMMRGALSNKDAFIIIIAFRRE